VLLASAFSLQYASSSRPVPVRPKRMDLKATRQPEYGNFATRPASLMPLQLASRLLLVIGIIGVIHLPGFFMFLFGPVPWNTSAEQEKALAVRPMLVFLSAFNAMIGFMAIVSSQRIKRAEGCKLARIASILTIPFSLFATPFAIWCLIVLGRIVPIDESNLKSGSTMRRIIGITVALTLITFSVGLAVTANRQNQAVPQLLIETRNGDAAAVIRLLESGANPNLQKDHQGSPLF
jgi:hypothetical protein